MFLISQVIYKRLYKQNSAADHGTLKHLQNIVNRTNVPSKVKDNVNAAEDFFETVVVSHIIVATLTFFKMASMDDIPSFLTQVEKEDHFEKKSNIFHSCLEEMIGHYFNLSPFNTKDNEEHDQVRAYAREVFSLGILLFEMKDSIHEGDGERLMLVWKFLLLVFRASQKIKYSLEALLLLLQHDLLLPPRLKMQLKYSRFINTKGKEGKNISADLHLEHINKVVKSAMHSQSSNLTSTAIVRTGKCTGLLLKIAEQFDQTSNYHTLSDSHSDGKTAKDINRLIDQLRHVDVFANIPYRKHENFKTLKCSLTSSVKKNKETLVKWIEQHIWKQFI